MATLRQIMEKISYLQSKTSIEQAILSYVEANFLDNDAGDAEMSLARPDHGAVPQEHFAQYIGDISDRLDQVGSELHEWESIEVSMDDPETDEVEVEVKVKASPKTGAKKPPKKSSRTRRKPKTQ